MYYQYLSDDQLKRLDDYKYSAYDSSPLSKYVMHPFWNLVVELVPMSVAPNLLTVAGLGFTLLNVLLLTHYDYYFYASSDTYPTFSSIPDWVWLVMAVNLFMAHTLDGIDGKQARRTKATGPLGELMDHGVDSWTACFIPYCVYSMFGRADFSFSPVRMLGVFWSVFFTFYLSHWEKYITGTLYLPWSYDLSQLFLFGCFLTTSFKTYKVWKFTVPIINIECCCAFEILLYSSIFLTIPISIYNVYDAFTSGKNKYSSITEILRPILPLAFFFVVSMIWALFSRSNVVNHDPRLYYFTIGVIFSNIACRLIVCQMTSTRCEAINKFSILYTLVAVLVLLSSTFSQHELLILRLLALVVTLAHLHYIVCIVRQMCDHFRINCFSLRRRESADPSRQHLLRSPSNSLMSTTTPMVVPDS